MFEDKSQKLPVQFDLGRVVATQNALDVLETLGIDPLTLFVRHQSGDWGDLDDDDRKANDAALVQGERIFSSYKLSTGEKIWIITEWDRSSTTLLLPSDY